MIPAVDLALVRVATAGSSTVPCDRGKASVSLSGSPRCEIIARLVLVGPYALRCLLIDDMFDARLKGLVKQSEWYPATAGPRVVLVVDPTPLPSPTQNPVQAEADECQDDRQKSERGE